MSPDAGIAVGLQFETHRKRVRCRRIVLLRGAHLLLDTGQALNVMTDFVRDHVRARELARRPEATAELLEESEVEIHTAVLRTVEGARRRFGHAARRVNRVAEQHDARRLISRKKTSPRG